MKKAIFIRGAASTEKSEAFGGSTRSSEMRQGNYVLSYYLKSKAAVEYAVRKEYAKFLVAMRLGETPVPIPNTMVKT